MPLTVDELRAKLAGQNGLALDIDDTLAQTSLHFMVRLQERFGNPEGLTAEEMAKKYRLFTCLPDYWPKEELDIWVRQASKDTSFQTDGIAVMPGALEGVKALNVVAYITSRPSSTVSGTRAWLKDSGFPDLPILTRPPEITSSQGNIWKGSALRSLYPCVSGLVDDNLKVLDGCGADYQGKVYCFGHEYVKSPGIPCPTWASVVAAVHQQEHRNRSDSVEVGHNCTCPRRYVQEKGCALL